LRRKGRSVGEGKFVEVDETFIGGRARNRAYPGTCT
jgi:hypothetical protein